MAEGLFLNLGATRHRMAVDKWEHGISARGFFGPEFEADVK